MKGQNNQQISIFAYIPDPKEVAEYDRLKSLPAILRTPWQSRRLSYLRDKLQYYHLVNMEGTDDAS